MSIDLFAAFAVDPQAEKEGTYTQIPGAGDTRWLVARANSVKYQTMLSKAVKRNKNILDSGGEAARQKSDEILTSVMAKTILLGWEGKITYKGQQLEYSEDNAKLLLAHRDFRDAVMAVADSAEAFKIQQDEDDEKN